MEISFSNLKNHIIERTPATLVPPLALDPGRTVISKYAQGILLMTREAVVVETARTAANATLLELVAA